MIWLRRLRLSRQFLHGLRFAYLVSGLCCWWWFFPIPLAAAPSLPLSPTLAAQVDRLTAEATGPITVTVHPSIGTIRLIQVTDNGDLAPTITAAQTLPRQAMLIAKADNFWARYGQLFGLTDPATELQLTQIQTDTLAFTDLTYAQSYAGLPVFGGTLRAHFDASGKLTAVNGVAVPITAINPTPTLPADTAAARALAAVQADLDSTDEVLQVVANRLLLIQPALLQSSDGPLYLAYQVEVVNPRYTVRRFVFIDAHTGKPLLTLQGINDIEREISEGTLRNKVWDEGDGHPEPIPNGWASGTTAQVTAWNEALLGAKETYNLFGSLTNGTWLSYNGQDATMRTVNNDPRIACPNANWNSISTNYCNGVTGDDTVAHEWAHAYTEYTSNLIYAWQPGALNEAYSDIWGEVVDLLNGRGSDSPNGLRTAGSCSTFGAGSPANDHAYRWLSAEDDPGFNGAIRDLWNPVCYGDPGKVSDTQYTCDENLVDNGGVHINSGVPNHLFALLVDGGTYNNVTVAGIGLTRAAHIHWRAQRAYLTAVSDFSDQANALTAACTDLIGQPLYALTTAGPASWGTIAPETITADHCTAVAAAIAAVELRTPPSKCDLTPRLDPNTPALCTAPTNATTFYAQTWEAGLANWSVGQRSVARPSQFSIPNWSVVTNLPDNRSGSGAFGPDPLYNGDNCQLLDQSGVIYLQSPLLTIPPYATSPRLRFDHWFATEERWDGGNLKIRVNGGNWSQVSSSAFLFNRYNSSLLPTNNGNPLAGEPAFTGSNNSSVKGSWGQSQLDLSAYASPGDQIELRFEMGLDECNGLVGWYLDDVAAYACTIAPDLTLSQQATPTTAQPGQPVTYALTLATNEVNAAPATAVVVTNTLPSGVTVTGFSPGAQLLTTPTPRLIWSFAALEQTTVLTFTAVVSSNLLHDVALTNSAVMSASNDTNAANNTANSAVTVTVPRVGFATATQRARESAGQVPLTITVNAANPYAASQVNYVTLPGTATADADYAHLNGVATIAAGASTAILPLSLLDDPLVEGDETVQVMLTARAGTQLSQSLITVTIEDDDQPGLILQPLSTTTGEDGTTATIQATLTAQPAAPVTVTLSSSDPSEGKVTAQLLFTALNWQVPQTFLVTGVDDTIDDGDSSYQILATPTSNDPFFAALVPVALTLTNLDNDMAQLSTQISVQAPDITIGNVLTYHYAITNSGNVTLSQLSAVDHRLGPLPLAVTTLAPQQSTYHAITQTITITDLPQLVNTLTVTGLSVGNRLVTSQAQSRVKLLDVELTLVKSVGIEGIQPTCPETETLFVPVGTTVRYCYTVTNHGSYPLRQHHLADDQLGVLLHEVTFPLAPGASYSTTITTTLTISTTNVATWTSAFPYTATVTGEGLLSRLVEIHATDAVTVQVAHDDQDSDGDTIPDNVEGAADPDQDNLPNFLDTDADNDGLSDQEEVGPDPRNPRDSNGNGTPDYLERSSGLDPTQQLFLPLIRR
ncbi:MAG: M4 family metallopeptidase [Caldilineaceae bacterium]|nr:M4 family metallopeptidase [Caldilineaceae bacterium]